MSGREITMKRLYGLSGYYAKEKNKKKTECPYCGKMADIKEFIFYPDKTYEHKREYCKFVSPI